MELANAPLFFWLFAGLLTLAAIGSAIWPLLHAGQEAASGGQTDEATRQVLIDQLDEIRRDRERGLLNDNEEASARAEVARRLLALDREMATRQETNRQGKNRFYPWAMIIAIPFAALSFYSLSGAPGQPDLPVSARVNNTSQVEASSAGDQGIDALVEKVEAHLAKNPDDARGWQTIAPVYQRQGKLDKAEEAFRKALAIGSDDIKVMATLQTGLGQTLVMRHQGRVNEEAFQLFTKAQKNNADDPTGFFFEALGLSQAGKRDEAIVAWENVIERFGEGNAPWLDVARRTLALLKQEADNEAQGLQVPSRGPSADDVEEAESLSVEERNELIETMVSGLAARLEENPDDLAGWRRLIHSYMVLGRKNEAVDALEKARLALNDNQESKAALDATAAEYNL